MKEIIKKLFIRIHQIETGLSNINDQIEGRRDIPQVEGEDDKELERLISIHGAFVNEHRFLNDLVDDILNEVLK